MAETKKAAAESALAMKEKIEGLAKNEGFMESLLANETPEEAQAFLRGYGVEMTVDQLKAAGALIGLRLEGRITDADLAELERGVIPENLLAEISGGASETVTDWLKASLYTGGANAAAGMAVGALMGGPAGALACTLIGFAGGFLSGTAGWGASKLAELKW